MLMRKAREITRLVNEDKGRYHGFGVREFIWGSRLSRFRFQRWMLFTPQTALFCIWNCIPYFPSDLAVTSLYYLMPNIEEEKFESPCLVGLRIVCVSFGKRVAPFIGSTLPNLLFRMEAS